MFSLSRFLDTEEPGKGLLYRFYAVYLVSGLMNTMLGVLMPYLGEEYGLGYSLRGMLLSAVQVGNVTAMFLSGVLPFILGRKGNTVLFTSLMVIGYLVMLLSGNPALLFVAFLFTGLGRGTLVNISNVVVGESARNKGGALNLLHACFALGAFLAPLLVISTISLSWRVAPSIALALMTLGIILILTSTLSSKPSKREKGKGVIPRTLDFYLDMGILFSYVAAEAGLVGWLVTYFRDSGLLPEAVSASMQSLLWVMILFGRLGSAFLSERMSKNLLLLSSGILMTLSFLLMILAPSSFLIVLGVLGLGLFMGGIYPTTLATVPARYSSDTVTMGFLLGTATIGAILMPAVIGKIAETAGIAGGIASILVVCLLMLALMAVKTATRS